MKNKDIAKLLKKTAALSELHEENSFKTQAYLSAVFSIERLGGPISDMSDEQMLEAGIKKGMVAKIRQLLDTGTFEDLEKFKENTPAGIFDLLDVKGLGAKKIKALWKELNILSLEELWKACEDGSLAKAKGFGEKTVAGLLKEKEFSEESAGFWLFSKACNWADDFLKKIQSLDADIALYPIKELARGEETCQKIAFACDKAQKETLLTYLHQLGGLTEQTERCSPFYTAYTIDNEGITLEIYFERKNRLGNLLFLENSDIRFLQEAVSEKSLLQICTERNFESEQALFHFIGKPFIPAELRNGLSYDLQVLKSGEIPQLITEQDLKGILHNHSTYSDGKHSLKEMAEYCRELGYQYLGITDHSKSAFYANGMDEDRVLKQQAEIDVLNAQWSDFKIFKGIEVDILGDGSLDYSDEVLASFDFVIASIHAALQMGIEKATERLLNAIRNPFTSCLGHPTGRLLLKRQGYPIDYKKVIEACAEHKVCIEINSNPYRLDLEWRWLRYAIDAGVMLSINPDAHEKDGYADMKWGVKMGRKAGLSPANTLNCLDLNSLEEYLSKRKQSVSVKA